MNTSIYFRIYQVTYDFCV